MLLLMICLKVICRNPMIIGAAASSKGNASHYLVYIANRAGNESNVYILPIHKTLTVHGQPEVEKTTKSFTDSRFSSIDTLMRHWSGSVLVKWYSKGMWHLRDRTNLRR